MGKQTVNGAGRLIGVRQIATELGIPEYAARDLVNSVAIPIVRLPSSRAHVTGKAKKLFVDRRDLEAALESWKAR